MASNDNSRINRELGELSTKVNMIYEMMREMLKDQEERITSLEHSRSRVIGFAAAIGGSVGAGASFIIKKLFLLV